MKTGLYNIIPEGESHCVWMDAGLVNYKLCERNFACESCPFDVALKTDHRVFSKPTAMAPEPAPASSDTSAEICGEIISHLIDPLKKIPLPDDRWYFSNHSWIKPMNNGQYKVGIDGFLAHLLSPVMGAVLLNTPARLSNGSPFAWLIRDGKTLSLHSPVVGAVAATNSLLASTPSMLTADPYDQGWIAMLARHDEKGSATGRYSADQFHDCMKDDIERLESLLGSTLAQQRREIGTSLFDGGVRVDSIEQFIGARRYGQWLARICRPSARSSSLLLD